MTRTQKNRKLSAENSVSRSSAKVSGSALPPGVLLGDHLALDMLNTVLRTESGLVDLWQSDADVLEWLVLTGLLRRKIAPEFRPGALLTAARALREMVRALVTQRKAKKRLDLAVMNAFLAKGQSHSALTADEHGQFRMTRRYDQSTPEALLAPLAEAAAELLANGDFSLVRPCEGDGCVLWFYDRTKAHRRRWCSMAVCGNRHKVAKFRSG